MVFWLVARRPVGALRASVQFTPAIGLDEGIAKQAV